jgi:TorA maturation chaperone TorD
MTRTTRSGPGAGTSEAARTATERSNLYGFLAAVYRQEPTPPLLRRVRGAPLRKALAAAGAVLGADILDRPERELIENLAVEYTRLFIGPGSHIPPYASVHMKGEEGSLWGPSTAWAKRFIESTGLEYRPDYHDLPDHISVELEFMQQLAKHEARALERRDEDKLGALRQLQKEFLTGHLAAWAPSFCDKVIAQAELSFFREMAKLTKDFIRSESEILGQRDEPARS